jgi:hypothetical protein
MNTPLVPSPIRADIGKRLLKPVAWLSRTGDPHATLDRFFDSQHVEDLRLIVAAALFVALLLLVGCGVAFGYEGATLTGIGTFIAPALGVLGAILTWTYQVASARLGVVDLFACEISTLCRVALVVATVRRSVDRFNQGPPVGSSAAGGSQVPPARDFTSQENYFPVFENGTRDLQGLEAQVVINITAFYTFMKAVRDSQRMLAGIRPEPLGLGSPSNEAPLDVSWHEAARNVVYMLFLGLESARHAIADLVEFQPEYAERTIVVLLSELEAYRFLRSQFEDEEDMYHRRIMLRDPEYRGLVPHLRDSVDRGRELEQKKHQKESGGVRQWEPAWLLLPELERRYQEAVLNFTEGTT